VSFSPDGKFIATGTHSGKINIIGVESGKKESVLDTRGKFIMSIAYVSLTLP
jgi:WD repeat-containing protein 61